MIAVFKFGSICKDAKTTRSPPVSPPESSRTGMKARRTLIQRHLPKLLGASMNINIGPSTSNSTPRIASQMRPSLFLRALPPIPPPSQWKKTFPSPDFTVVNRLRAGGKNNAQCRRTQPIDDLLADELVKSFGIAEGTHVIEAFPGESGR